MFLVLLFVRFADLLLIEFFLQIQNHLQISLILFFSLKMTHFLDIDMYLFLVHIWVLRVCIMYNNDHVWVQIHTWVHF